MMEEVTNLSNLTASLKRVISNAGSAGVDGMNVKDLQSWFSVHYNELREELKQNAYRVNQIRGLKIRKPKGGYRQLGIPTVKDRLVQQSIHQTLLYNEEWEQINRNICGNFDIKWYKLEGMLWLILACLQRQNVSLSDSATSIDHQRDRLGIITRLTLPLPN